MTWPLTRSKLIINVFCTADENINNITMQRDHVDWYDCRSTNNIIFGRINFIANAVSAINRSAYIDASVDSRTILCFKICYQFPGRCVYTSFPLRKKNRIILYTTFPLTVYILYYNIIIIYNRY